MRDLIAGWEAAARAQVRALVVRLQRTTPRERVLLGGLVLGFLIILPITSADWRVTQEDRYVDALTDRAGARLAATAARRVQAAVEDETALEDMATWGFNASNVDVARVMIEDQLARAAREAELTGFSITTEEEVEAIGPTQWLGAEVQADLRWSPVFGFIDRIAAWPEGFRVVAFSYELTPPPAFTPPPPRPRRGAVEVVAPPPPSGKMRIRLAFPVNLTAQAAEASAPQTTGGMR